MAFAGNRSRVTKWLSYGSYMKVPGLVPATSIFVPSSSLSVYKPIFSTGVN